MTSNKSKKLTIAGMCLWDVDIEYDGFASFTGPTMRTLVIATRRKAMLEAQKKTTAHLKAFRYDYPKAKVVGMRYRGFIDA